MSTNFRLPSEEEIRRAYKIPPEQKFRIEVAESLPDPSWVQKTGAYLENAADFFGVPTFLMRNAGLVLAVFFLPYWGPKVQEEVKSAVVITYDYWMGPFQKLPYQNPEYPFSRYAVITPTANTVSQNVTFFETGKLPTGTTFVPITGNNI